MKTLLAQMEAMCACGCDRKPEAVDPLPEGWCWDTEEPDNFWCHCPESTRDDWTAEDFGEWLRIQRAMMGRQTERQPWPRREA